MVIVDTSVWVQFLRVSGSIEHLELDELLARGEAVMVGAVLAELLQGARNQREYESLRERLTALPYVEETQDTWTRVGALSYQLRQIGQAVVLVGLLIAALALEHGPPRLHTGRALPEGAWVGFAPTGGTVKITTLPRSAAGLPSRGVRGDENYGTLLIKRVRETGWARQRKQITWTLIWT
jgi:predicted nucleic acid-binding protein